MGYLETLNETLGAIIMVLIYFMWSTPDVHVHGEMSTSEREGERERGRVFTTTMIVIILKRPK